MLDLQIEKHRQLWMQVFPDEDPANETNVTALFAMAHSIWCVFSFVITETYMVHANVHDGRTFSSIVAITCPYSRNRAIAHA
jgi:hypothetical protein